MVETINFEGITLKLHKNKKIPVASSNEWKFWGKPVINVDELFTDMPKNIQKSIVYHELWHCKNNLKYELRSWIRPWLIFYHKPVYCGQEFEADKNAVKMNGVDNTILMIKALQKLVSDRVIHEDTKRHPPLKERLEKIQGIKKNGYA